MKIKPFRFLIATSLFIELVTERDPHSEREGAIFKAPTEDVGEKKNVFVEEQRVRRESRLNEGNFCVEFLCFKIKGTAAITCLRKMRNGKLTDLFSR